MNLGPQLQPTGVNVHETCFILENRLGNGWLAGNLQPSATWHLGRPPRRLAMVALAHGARRLGTRVTNCGFGAGSDGANQQH
jgi:hypothetical protein